MKKFFVMLTASVFLLSCGTDSGTDKPEEEKKDDTVYSTDQLMEIAEKYVDKEVTVEGINLHVCEHGGKRMFIRTDGNEARLKVVPGKNVSDFRQEDEGKVFVVTGTLKERRVDHGYLDNWEKELKEDLPEEHHIHDGLHCDTETHHDAELDSELAKVENMRRKIQESDKDYLSFFSLEATSVKEKE